MNSTKNMQQHWHGGEEKDQQRKDQQRRLAIASHVLGSPGTPAPKGKQIRRICLRVPTDATLNSPFRVPGADAWAFFLPPPLTHSLLEFAQDPKVRDLEIQKRAQSLVPRKQTWFSETGPYKLRAGILPANSAPPALREMVLFLEPAFPGLFCLESGAGILLNRYPGWKECEELGYGRVRASSDERSGSVPPHKDNEFRRWLETPIVSVSLFSDPDRGTQPFCFWRDDESGQPDGRVFEVETRHGLVIVMGDTFQLDFTHELRKTTAAVERFNLTLRAPPEEHVKHVTSAAAPSSLREDKKRRGTEDGLCSDGRQTKK